MAKKQRKPGINSPYAKKLAKAVDIKKEIERLDFAYYDSVRRNIPVLDGTSRKNRLRALNIAHRFDEEARASTLNNAKFRRLLMRK
jgi:hypothetical protein